MAGEAKGHDANEKRRASNDESYNTRRSANGDTCNNREDYMSGMWRRTCALPNGTPPEAITGKQFYGCSGFPRCRYILNIAENLEESDTSHSKKSRKYMNGIKKKAEGEKYGIDGIIKAKKNLPEI